jgi:energy-coupling factor transporter ATP-binding protein EcfA2
VRLLNAEVRGYGRLVDAKINLDCKVIAVVGPNESGKTTLLTALAHIDSSEPVGVAERSRAVNIPDGATIVSANFALNEADRDAVAELDLDQPPRTMTASRPAGGGNMELTIQPEPRKERTPLRRAFDLLRAMTGREDLTDTTEIVAALPRSPMDKLNTRTAGLVSRSVAG